MGLEMLPGEICGVFLSSTPAKMFGEEAAAPCTGGEGFPASQHAEWVRGPSMSLAPDAVQTGPHRGNRDQLNVIDPL